MSWTDNLSEDVRIRLCECRSRKDDIPILARAKWEQLREKQGYCPEDALVAVLDLLDENGFDNDLTTDEYANILCMIGGRRYES